MSVNKVFLLGNLGKDPELRYTSNQNPVASFSVATTERRKDATGNWVDQTEWHNIVVFGTSATNCSKYLKKGRQAFIEGRIQTRKWQDKEGKDRYTTEILAERVQFIGGRQDREGDSGGDFGSDHSSGGMSAMAAYESLKSGDQIGSMGAPSGGDVSFDEDDIPF